MKSRHGWPLLWKIPYLYGEENKGKTQITKIRNERRDIMRYLIEVKNISICYEQLYINKLDHLNETD